MPYYKDKNDNLHFLENEEFSHILPGDCVKISDNEAQNIQDATNKTDEQIIKSFIDVIQKRLDDFAKTRGYDGILSACTYATSAVPKFATEGQYCVNSRDATWAAAYVILDDVQSGNRTMPTIETILSELPVLQWPNS